MDTQRYLPKRYRKDSRSRRKRNRIRSIVLIAIALLAALALGYMIYRWAAQSPDGGSVIPAASVSPATT